MSTIEFSHLRLLAVFATVVECGSFAGTARKLHSSRSRISEQVAQLEKDLGVRLLQRSTRQLKITLEGQQVYAQARQLPEILSGVEAAVTAQVPSGRVAITMNHDIAHKYLLPVLRDFQVHYPQVELDLILNDSRLDLISEQIDLAIRIGVPRDDSVIARVLHQETFGLFASPEYLARHGTPNTLADLHQHSWINFHTPSINVVGLQEHGKYIEIEPRYCYRCNSPLMMQQMVLNGLGIGALLPTTVHSEIAAGRLVQLVPSVSSETVVFSLVYPSRRQIPPRTRAVIDYLLAADMFATR